MRVSLVVLEKLYAVCDHDYPDEYIDDFDRLLWAFNQSSENGFVEINDYKELFFEGITDEDKQKLIEEINKSKEEP